MSLGSVAAFLKAKIRVGSRRQQDLARINHDAALRAQKARVLVTSEVFIEAYQDELADVVEALLMLDMGKPESKDLAVALLARAQGIQAIARRLSGYVTTQDYENEKARRSAA